MNFDCAYVAVHMCSFVNLQASQLEMFNGHFHWIVIINSLEQYESIVELLSVLDISISSRVALFRMKIDVAETTLYEIW